jgi:hypothetical protein
VIDLDLGEFLETEQAVTHPIRRGGDAAVQRDAHFVETAIDHGHACAGEGEQLLRFPEHPGRPGQRPRRHAGFAQSAGAQQLPRLREPRLERGETALHGIQLTTRRLVQRLLREERAQHVASSFEVAPIRMVPRDLDAVQFANGRCHVRLCGRRQRRGPD